MKIFVAGATGAIGLPLVRVLRALHYEVTGMTRAGAGSTGFASSAQACLWRMPFTRSLFGTASKLRHPMWSSTN
jgi:hypothetical protein